MNLNVDELLESCCFIHAVRVGVIREFFWELFPNFPQFYEKNFITCL